MASADLARALVHLERRVHAVSRLALQVEDRSLAEDLSMMAGFLDGERRRVEANDRLAADQLRRQLALDTTGTGGY